jgi:hypothetical protein
MHFQHFRLSGYGLRDRLVIDGPEVGIHGAEGGFGRACQQSRRPGHIGHDGAACKVCSFLSRSIAFPAANCSGSGALSLR